MNPNDLYPMSGEQKTGVWITAIIAGLIAFFIFMITWYYYEKDQRQAARGKANVDIVCTVKTPPGQRP